jgi:hypothetical protein
MPWGWISLQTVPSAYPQPTTSRNPGLPADPEELQAFVQDVVKNAGATFVAMYFEVGQPRAHVIVKGLDNYKTAKAVTEVLHATGYTKLLDARLAKGARRMEGGLRKRHPRRKTASRRRPRTE